MTLSRGAPGPALLLALLAPALVLLFPPESAPTGRLVLALFAAAALLVLGIRPAVPPRSEAVVASVLLLPLAAAALLAAPARARAVDEAALLAALILAGLIGREAIAAPRGAERLATLLAVLGAAVSLLAIAQTVWIYPHAAAAIRADGEVTDAFTDATLVRLEAGRPAGPFVLPTALAGFLAMSLAATGMAARAARPRGRILAALALALQVVALLLTRSLGGLLATTAAAALLVGRGAGRRGRVALAALGIGALLAAGGFLVARRAEIGGAPGRDPLTLRAGNWRAAATIALEHPLLGAGPGGFATAYTATLRPGMNETRYAHNSWLQLCACWGLWIAGPLLCGALRFRRAVGGPGGALRDPDPARAALAAGGAAFLLHNLIDFTLFLPSVAITGGILVGSVFGPTPPASPGDPPGGRRLASWRGAGAVLLAGLLLFHGARAARVAAAMERAQAMARAGRVDAALGVARRAAAVRPGDPDPQAFVSELILAEKRDDPSLLAEGAAAAARAVRLDPRSAVRHATRAAYHALQGEPAPAAIEMGEARALYPGKPQYHLSEEAR